MYSPKNKFRETEIYIQGTGMSLIIKWTNEGELL